MPKTTVWHHIQKVRVSPRYAEVLRRKQGGNRKKVEKRWKVARERATLLLSGKHRELSIVAAMLYWAEGNNKASCDFVNSDSEMIKIYLSFLRNVVKVDDSQIKITIRIISSMDQNSCLDYWSNITKIHKQRIKVLINDGGSKSRTSHGMCRVVIGKGGAGVFKLLRSLIDLYSKSTIKT